MSTNPQLVTIYTDISVFASAFQAERYGFGALNACTFSNNPNFSLGLSTVEDVQAIGSSAGVTSPNTQIYTVIALDYQLLNGSPSPTSNAPVKTPAEKAAALAAHEAQGIPLLPK